MFLLIAVRPGGVAPTAPTASQPPEVIDRIWQKASSKYDHERGHILGLVDQTIDGGPYRADWDSLQTYEAPAWYRDAKFGIFIHWGVYSVPAFGSEWYPRNMYRQGSPEYTHHIATYGPQDKFGYKDFIPMFKAEHFDPAAWAHLFRRVRGEVCGAGRRASRWLCHVRQRPQRLDSGQDGAASRSYRRSGQGRSRRRSALWRVVAPRRAQLLSRCGTHDSVGRERSQVCGILRSGAQLAGESAPNAAGQRLYLRLCRAWTDDWLARSSELVEKYHPDIMYFDWWIGQPSVRPALTRFAAFYYNASLKYGDHVGVINYKDYAMQDHSAVLDLERGQLGDIRPFPWQTDTSISNKSWGYIEHDTFKSPEFVIRSAGRYRQQERQSAHEYRPAL